MNLQPCSGLVLPLFRLPALQPFRLIYRRRTADQSCASSWTLGLLSNGWPASSIFSRCPACDRSLRLCSCFRWIALFPAGFPTSLLLFAWPSPCGADPAFFQSGVFRSAGSAPLSFHL